MSYLIRRVLAKPRLILDEMCRLYGKFASYLRRVLCKTRLIFPRINGPIEVNCKVFSPVFSLKQNKVNRKKLRGNEFWSFEETERRMRCCREIKNASFLRLKVKIFHFLRLSTKFLAVLRLVVNPIETLLISVKRPKLSTELSRN